MNQPPVNDRITFLEEKIVELQAITARLSRRQAYPQFLTVEEVAEMFQVKRGTVDGWVSAGIIPYRKVAGSTRFLLSELVEWTKPQRLRKVG